MKLLWKSLEQNRGLFAGTVFVGLIYSAVSIALPEISGKLVSGFLSDFESGAKILVIYLLFSLFQILLFLLDEKANRSLEIRQKRLMRKNAFGAFSQKASAKNEEISDFTSFVNNDIPCAAEQFFRGTVDIIKCVSLILFSAFSLLKVHAVFALIILGLSVCIVGIPSLMRSRSGIARSEYSNALAKYNTSLRSFLGGLGILAAYGCRPAANAALEEDNLSAAASEEKLAARQRTVLGVTAALQTAKTVLILVLGALMVSKKAISVGDIVVVLQLDTIIGAPIEVLAYMIHSKNEAKPLLDKYLEMTKVQKPKFESNENPSPFRSLRVESLRFEADGNEILKGVNAEFSAGKKYLITGPSGGGKSSLLRIAAGLEEAFEGEILFNEKDFREISPEEYHRRVCPVFQEPYLFHASLEENILLGRDIPREAYEDILKKLNLGYLLERYEDRPMTAEVSENLSGGEKQRVCLARAMVSSPEVYLLDEVLSALDKENADVAEKLILEQSAMVIHVCHKPNPKTEGLYDAHFELSGGVLKPVS